MWKIGRTFAQIPYGTELMELELLWEWGGERSPFGVWHQEISLESHQGLTTWLSCGWNLSKSRGDPFAATSPRRLTAHGIKHGAVLLEAVWFFYWC